MSMSIADMYQEMIDQHTELYMYRKAHKGDMLRSEHEDLSLIHISEPTRPY